MEGEQKQDWGNVFCIHTISRHSILLRRTGVVLAFQFCCHFQTNAVRKCVHCTSENTSKDGDVFTTYEMSDEGKATEIKHF